jgi:hypothetical protein
MQLFKTTTLLAALLAASLVNAAELRVLTIVLLPWPSRCWPVQKAERA